MINRVFVCAFCFVAFTGAPGDPLKDAVAVSVKSMRRSVVKIGDTASISDSSSDLFLVESAYTEEAIFAFNLPIIVRMSEVSSVEDRRQSLDLLSRIVESHSRRLESLSKRVSLIKPRDPAVAIESASCRDFLRDVSAEYLSVAKRIKEQSLNHPENPNASGVSADALGAMTDVLKAVGN